MPIYEYECKECRGEFEVLVRSAGSDSRPGCPDCGSQDVRRVLSLMARPVRAAEAVGAGTGAGAEFGGGGCCGGACGCGH